MAVRPLAHRLFQLFRRRSRLLLAARDERGAMLAEAVVGITVLTLLGGAVLSAMSTTHLTSVTIEASAIAENIARNQMETVLAEPFPDPLPRVYDPYLPLEEFPSGYEVTAMASALGNDPDVALVQVTVWRNELEVLAIEVLRLREP